jgi:hypothetical protein
MYTPEHIETSHFENDYQERHESKGGYSVAKLLEQRGGQIGGSLNESNERSVGGGSSESLMSRIKDLYIPVGLVTRHYPNPIKKRNETTKGKCISEDLMTKLEDLIYKNKSTENKTMKMEKHEENNYTRKHRKIT